MSRRELYRAAQDSVLLAVEFVVTTTFSADATDYWTIDVRRVRGDEAFGQDVSEQFSLATHTLTAGEPVTLYEDDHGFDLEADDRIVAELTENGSPSALDNPVFWLKVQPTTR